jgi:hypothetical protein
MNECPPSFFTAKLAAGELLYELNRLLINLSAKLTRSQKIALSLNG